jgi:hypothetical protein
MKYADRVKFEAALRAYGWPPPDKFDDHVDRLIAAINAIIDRDRLDDLTL